MERRPRITNTYHRRIPFNIPEEIIIEEILPKLPVKSLLRFKCVSKSWRSLISSKHFVKTHLENSKKNKSFPHHSIIAVCSKSVGVLNSCPFYPLLTERSTRASPLDYPMADPSKLLIAGCCNGLICILNGANKFLLWNPATRESKELPDFFTTGVFDPLQYSYGFGFDEISGDYKVFAFTYVGKYIIGKVYSLKANSWRETKVYSDGPPFYREFEEVATFASGKFHWICEYKIKTEMQWEIACFDLKSENFAMVEKPSFNEEDARVYPSLGVVDGCLCLFCKSPIQFDIWIWTKYDGVEKYSWGKFANISYLSDPWTPSSYMTAFLCPFPPSWIPLCVLPNGEVLFTYGSSFVIFDRKDNEYKQRYIDNFEDVDQVEVYVESLVSLVSDDDDGDVEDGQSA